MPDQAFAADETTVTQPSYSGGSGTADDPYQIANAQDMLAFTNAVNAGVGNDKSYVLTADIDLSSVCSPELGSWTPVGSADSPERGRPTAVNGFCGSFDGQGHTISNLYVNRAERYSALFGCIYNGASLKNFVVKGSVTSTESFVAGVVAYVGDYTSGNAPCSIENVGNEADVSFTGTYTNRYIPSNVGGVVGLSYLQSGSSSRFHTISRCYNAGTITSTWNGVGGICGTALFMHFTSCLNTGSVTSTFNEDDGGTYTGGIVGDAMSEADLNACVNTGSVVAPQTSLSLLGAISGSRSLTTNGCYWLDGSCVRGVGFTSTDVTSSFTDESICLDAADMQSNATITALNAIDDAWVLGYTASADGPRLAWTVPSTYPVVTDQPDSGKTMVGGSAAAMSVSVEMHQPSSETLTNLNYTYQWYRNTTRSYDGATAVEGATDFTYTPTTAEKGYFYYYFCTVTANWLGGSGQARSDIAQLIVADYVPATPVVASPEGYTVGQCLIADPLTVTVAMADQGAGTLSYQWYSCSDENKTNSVAIEGATEASYTPPTDDVGTVYYYCAVTNTYMDSDSETVTSTPAKVTVNALSIGDAQTMKRFAEAVNSGKTYAGLQVNLVADIDLSGVCNAEAGSWTPIGASGDTMFEGTFKGNGHTISGLYIDTDAPYTGLFGVCMNASFSDFVIQGQITSSSVYVGDVCGYLLNDTSVTSTFDNIRNEVAITTTAASETSVGGLIGFVDAYEEAPVMVTACTNKAPITARGSYVAGLVGEAKFVVIASSYNTAAVTSTTTDDDARIGGLSNTWRRGGYAMITLRDCYNVGTVSAPNSAGNNVGSLNGYSATFIDGDWWLEGTAAQGFSEASNDPSLCVMCTQATMASDAFLDTVNPSDYADSLKKFASGSMIYQTYPCLKWEIPAGTPTITSQPSDQAIVVGQTPTSLRVGVELPASGETGSDGTLSYQWYVNTEPSTTGGTPVDGATSFRLTLGQQDTAGTFYYYCVVTNSWGSAPQSTATIVTRAALVSVASEAPAAVAITEQPVDAEAEQDVVPAAFSVTATMDETGGQGTLSYQWYSCDDAEGTNPVAINGATEASYVPDSSVLGDHYYYCEVSNFYYGIAQQTVRSSVVKLTVTTIKIDSAEELAQLADNVAAGNTYDGRELELTADIDLSEVCGPDSSSWTPIGVYQDSELGTHPFSGTFEGNGHVIYGLYINGDAKYRALFGYLDGATLKDFVVAGSVTGPQYVSGVVAMTSTDPSVRRASTISCVGNEASVTATGTSSPTAGGVLADSSAMYGNTVIERCYNKGAISVPNASSTGSSYAGGIAGRAVYVTISSCYNTGTVSSPGYYIGGISGYSASTSSSSENVYPHCYNTGTITCTSQASDDYVTFHGAIMGMPGSNYSGSMPTTYYLATSDTWPVGYGIGYSRYDADVTAVNSPSDIDMDKLGTDYVLPTASYYNNGYPRLTWEVETADGSGLQQAIDLATADLEATTVSADGSDVDVNTQWVSQQDADTLASAISDARSVLYNRMSTQDELDAAAGTLLRAKNVFDEAKQAGTKAIDTSALEAAIQAANEDRNATYVSDDGTDVYFYHQWVPRAANDAFAVAVYQAQSVLDDTTATQAQVDAAAAALAEAQTTFDAAKAYGTMAVDKTKLNDAIQAAYDDRASVPVSVDGSDIAASDQWVTQSEVDALTVAIMEANTVADSDTATLDDVNNAITALQEAVATFDAAKDYGLKQVDKTVLADALAAAQADFDETLVSADGTDVEPTSNWVTQQVDDDFAVAIEDAQAVYDKATATVEEVQAAADALVQAQETFDAAKQPGTKPSTLDLSELSAAIDAATEDKDSTLTSTDGSDVASDTLWVTNDAYDALVVAIAQAQQVVTTATTQEEVDAAAATLAQAQEDFDASKSYGTLKTDKSELGRAIADAKTDLASVVVSVDGSDVAEGEHWVTQDDADALTSAIADAQAVYDKTSPEATAVELQNATEALQAALASFDAAKDGGAAALTDIAQATIAPIADQRYTGKAIEPAPAVTLGSQTLVEGTDYTVTYEDNVEAGTATVTITGIGSYTGTAKASFTIVGRHTVVKNATAHGTVTVIDSADGTAATLYPYAGDTVTFRTSPDTGYTLTRMSYSYTDPATGEQKTVPLTRISGTGRAGTNAVYSFTMPDADVTLNAEFGENHRTIHKEIAGEGVLIIQEQADGTAATLYPQPGSKVRFKAIPAQGYKLTNVYYTVEGQDKHLALTRVEGTTNVYEFTMPNWNVTLHAVYVEK